MFYCQHRHRERFYLGAALLIPLIPLLSLPTTLRHHDGYTFVQYELVLQCLFATYRHHIFPSVLSSPTTHRHYEQLCLGAVLLACLLPKSHVPLMLSSRRYQTAYNNLAQIDQSLTCTTDADCAIQIQLGAAGAEICLTSTSYFFTCVSGQCELGQSLEGLPLIQNNAQQTILG